MTTFPEFVATHGPATAIEPASAATIKKYKSTLPAALIQFWRENGFCAYAGGLIWIVNPDDFVDLLEDWEVPEGAVVFGRTAFADLLLWAENQVQYLFVHHGRITALTDDIGMYMDALITESSYVKDGLLGGRYAKVVKKLGRPARDECYTFVPALALGGSGKPETIQKVKLREQLGILAEMVGS